jgi:hypothetical protein
VFRADVVENVLDDVLPHGGVVAMLKAYFDKGAKKEADGIMAIGAALFKPTPYKRFCREWNKFLAWWDAPAFHATDFYTGGGDYFYRANENQSIIPERKARFDSDSKRIPSIIGAHMRVMVAVSFKTDEFLVVAPENWRERFGSLHSVACQFAAMAISHWAKKSHYNGQIAYFFEKGDEEQDEVKHAFDKLFDNPIHRRNLRMAASPIFVEKGAARGLEVADFLAWHWNKYYADTLANYRNPRDMRKDIAALLHMRPDDVITHLFTGDALESALIEQGCTRKTNPNVSSGALSAPPSGGLTAFPSTLKM